MKNSRQREILVELAHRHGLTVAQAEEIWNSLGSAVSAAISADHRDQETTKFVVEKFPVIHIEHFGKFIPNKKRINYANYCITKKKQDEA